MKKSCLGTKVLSVFLIICTLMPFFTAFANAAIDHSKYDLQYHSTLYYDATNPYNNVYGNSKYAYKCYVSKGLTKGAGVVFEKDGMIVANADVNTNLLKMYFAQNSMDINTFATNLEVADDYISISDARKLNSLISDVSEIASKSLGNLTAVYLTGGTFTASAIAKVVAEQAIDSISSHFTDIGTIISEAQLNLFYIYVAELENVRDALVSQNGLNSFSECEKYVANAERLERISYFVKELIPAVTEGLTGNFYENLKNSIVDVASGFVGAFGEWLDEPSKILELQKNSPNTIANAILLAKHVKEASELMSLDALADIKEMHDDALSEMFCIVDAYKAYTELPTSLFVCERMHQVALTQFTDMDDLPNTSSAIILDGLYTLENVSSGLMLDVNKGIDADATNVGTWKDTETNNQKFYVKHVGDGKYVFFAQCSSDGKGGYTRCIDVYTGDTNVSPAAGDNVDIYTRESKWNDCQYFYLVPMSDGSYVLENCAVPNLVIGSESPVDGYANVKMQTWAQNDLQKWRLSATTAKEEQSETPSNTITEEEFAKKIVSLQAEYPHGKYWSLSNGKITSGRYKGTALAGDKSCTSASNCGAFAINGTETAWQCHGFALLLSDKIFGSNRNTNTSLWQRTNYTRGSFSGQVYAGDILRLYSTKDDEGHTIFVYKVTSDRIYYADCNSNYDCGIRWTSKKISTIKEDIVYVLHYQNNTLQGIPYIHIQYHANGGVTTGTDYYIQDSMIFTTKHSAVHQQNLQYGVCLESGLYNDKTFELTRDGYTFLGWTLTPDGNEIWDQDAPLYPEDLCPELKDGDKTIIVYAAWQKNECEHTPLVETAQPTCTEQGYSVSTCSICGVELSRTEIPATGHNYSSKITDATCLTDGKTVYTCTNCSDTFTETIPATGHNYVDNVCANCGDVIVTEYGVELHASDAQATAGETVTVDIVLDKNLGFTYLNLYVDYDKNALELVSVENGGIVDTFMQGITMIWAQAMNTTDTGVLVTLTFAVKEDAAAGDYRIDVTCIECCDEKEQDVAVKITDGTVTVVDFVYGDCNGDQKVNGKDVTRLLQYLANVDPFTGVSSSEINKGADSNGDGKINGKDVTRLLQYLANVDPFTGESSVVLGPTK